MLRAMSWIVVSCLQLFLLFGRLRTWPGGVLSAAAPEWSGGAVGAWAGFRLAGSGKRREAGVEPIWLPQRL